MTTTGVTKSLIKTLNKMPIRFMGQVDKKKKKKDEIDPAIRHVEGGGGVGY